MAHQELAEQIARYAERDGIMDMPIARLALVRSGQRGEPVHMVQRPALCIIAQGGKRVLLGDAVIDYGPANYLVASLDLPITGAVTQASADAPYLCFCLYLDPALLSEIALTLPPLPAGADESSGMTLHPMTPELIDAATRLTALLSDPANAPLLAPLIERELLVRLMTGPGGSVLRAIASGESRTGQIAQAIGWLKTHFREPFSGAHLAALAGMSLSSFHDHFRRATAMTPLQYQKQLRLQEARALMLADRLDAAEAGFRVGYDSPSQFSREYRRLFGAPPVRDMGRLRAKPQMAMVI
ncbi:AraC family transcriptional regulator [Novosphingobium sp. PhB55]|uniref:AraC family transcriptional regulator n=1 Tax=Novosphingobium sp. PhB55 TaxID=2485106 RepID=UPI001066DE5F|nr:AraC family transcriptional regulator [Novosphingobium sp. PhB55]TDW61471.1 AraC family transcriptional regulator [Novosphingobium sp. PhB55]